MTILLLTIYLNLDTRTGLVAGAGVRSFSYGYAIGGAHSREVTCYPNKGLLWIPAKLVSFFS